MGFGGWGGTEPSLTPSLHTHCPDAASISHTLTAHDLMEAASGFPVWALEFGDGRGEGEGEVAVEAKRGRRPVDGVFAENDTGGVVGKGCNRRATVSL